MATSHGKFVWYELMTTDTKAAGEFYSTITGWTAHDAGAGMNYTLLHAGDRPIAGMMPVPAGTTAPPHWIGYIYVDDVDASASAITSAGGQIHRQPDSIPSVGRFAVVADPQGAAFIIFKPDPEPANPPPPPAPDAPGIIGWRELLATEWKSAFDFYAAQFGWAITEVHDMGPMGTYQLFATGEQPVGGIMTKPAQMPYPAWQYYINVADIDEAVSHVKAGGGTIMNGPHQVPGGSWIVNAVDPQGARFSLVGPKAP